MNNKKCKFVLKICAFTIMCIYNPAFAQVRNGDSVIERSPLLPPNPATSSSGNVTRNSATPQGRVEYTETACPSGYTGADGGSTFTTQQRMISSFVYNGATRTSTGPWEAVTNDYCTRRETRSATCPSGQTGSATEARTITYNTSGYSYGSWATSSSTCTTPPPPACTPTSSSRSTTCTSTYGSGYSGRIYYETNYTCNSSGQLVAGREQYVRDTCRLTSPPPPPPVVRPPPPPVQPPPVVRPPPVTVTPQPPVYNPPAVICWPDQWNNTAPCPAGQTGQMTSTTYRECRNGPYSPGYEYQGNFGNTCRTPAPPPPVIPPPPPPPAGCWLNGMGYYAGIGSVHSACDVQGYGMTYNRGQNYKCTAGGWANNNRGNSMYQDYCP